MFVIFSPVKLSCPVKVRNAIETDRKSYRTETERPGLEFHPSENQLLRDEIIQMIVPGADRTSFFQVRRLSGRFRDEAITEAF